MRVFLFVFLLCVLAAWDAVAQSTGATAIQQTLLTEAPTETSPDTATLETLPHAGACGPSPLRVVTHCEAGAAFLCVNTPPGGVTEDHVTLTGLIDRTNHAFAGLKIAIQHDQTKVLQQIDTAQAVAADGTFTFDVALPQLGSYTVVVQALRAHADPMVERVHISRVIAPNGAQAAVQLDPDPSKTNHRITGQTLTVRVDLLPQCEQCDFIGSTTGGTLITVQNTITSSSGTTQRVERTTDLGADGVFSLCVPVGNGANQLDLYACNAATGFDLASCEHLAPMHFTGDDGQVRVELLEPTLDQQSVVTDQRPLPIRFRVNGLDETATCLNAVQLAWNREDPTPLCPDAEGIYQTTVAPEVGINVGTITVKGANAVVERAFHVGWGTLRTPFEESGAVKAESWWERDTVLVGLHQRVFTDMLRTIANNVVRSDRMREIIQDLVQGPTVAEANPAAQARADAIAKIKQEIPGCDTVGGLPGTRMELVGPPTWDNFEIARIALNTETMQFDLLADQLAVQLKLSRDENDDGVADGVAIPLRIAFERIAISPLVRLQQGAKPLVLLTSQTNTCDYQDDDYCTNRPAILMPQQFVGDATTAGGFVICDHEGQAVDADVAEGCEALNVINAQTGMLSAQVLSAVNDLLYCNGSSLLTYWLREGTQHMQVQVGCGEAPPTDPLAISAALEIGDCQEAHHPLRDRVWTLPFGITAGQGGLRIGADGVWARLASRAGNPGFLQRLPDTVRRQQPGYLVESDAATHATANSSAQNDLALGLNETVLNQLLFLLGVQGDAALGTGPLDWDLHDLFLASAGFEPTKRCDAFVPAAEGDKRSPLCDLRPRVKEIFGSVLTTYEYFSPNHPLLLRIRGSRRLMPHIRFFRADVPDQIGDDGAVLSWRNAQFIDFQIPDLEISVYALAIDPDAPLDAAGNPRMLLDEHGQPRIASMRPELADPLSGPIVRARMSLLLPLEIGALHPDPDDPSHYAMRFRTNSDLTKMIFTVDDGDNSTIIPATNLLSNFREKLLTGVSAFASERDAFTVRIAKRFLFPQNGDGLASLLGLHDVRFAKDGLRFGINEGQDYVDLGASLHFTQHLVIGGDLIEWTIPEF